MRAALALVLGAGMVMACGGDAPETSGGGAAGSGEWEPLVAFDTVAVAIETDTDTLRITAELADDDDRRAYGLMERTELPEEHGMLFVYPQPQGEDGAFWMYRTNLALDIAFLDEDGRIVAQMVMEPCESPDPRYCRRYSPGVPYSAALEMNEGFFDRHEVGIGDRVRVVESAAGAAQAGAEAAGST